VYPDVKVSSTALRVVALQIQSFDNFGQLADGGLVNATAVVQVVANKECGVV
jgi:hypothetical protein